MQPASRAIETPGKCGKNRRGDISNPLDAAYPYREIMSTVSITPAAELRRVARCFMLNPLLLSNFEETIRNHRCKFLVVRPFGTQFGALFRLILGTMSTQKNVTYSAKRPYTCTEAEKWFLRGVGPYNRRNDQISLHDVEWTLI
jgi:hypothetical protein